MHQQKCYAVHRALARFENKQKRTVEDRAPLLQEFCVQLDGELKVRSDPAEQYDVVDRDVRQRAVDVRQKSEKSKIL